MNFYFAYSAMIGSVYMSILPSQSARCVLIKLLNASLSGDVSKRTIFAALVLKRLFVACLLKFVTSTHFQLTY